MRDIAHLLRPGHLAQLAHILDDPEASPNDRFVALELLKNANIAAGGVLPSCQDTGTAIVMGKKGQFVFTGGGDEAAIARGVFDTYATSNLRYSQLAPLDMYREVNTGTNLPAQIEIYATDGDAYKFLFMAKGGGSANKSYLFQETKALLNPESLLAFLEAKLRIARHRGLPALSPGDRHRRHLGRAHAEGGQAGVGALPRRAAQRGQQAGPRLSRSRAGGAGAGARAEDRHRRAVRRQVLLPRRARHPPAAPRRLLPGRASPCRARRIARRWARSRATACSSSSSRPIRRSTCPRPRTTIWPARCVRIDLTRPMAEIRATLSRYPIRTRLSLTGPLVVARDIAHAKIKERLDRGEGMPQYLRDYMVYYAGPGQDAGGLRLGLVRARPRPGAWTPTSICSSRTAAAW